MNATLRNPATFAVIGLAAALLFAAVWIAAALLDPSWEFGVNTLSDMGVSDVQATAYLFNYGCIATGVLIVVYGLGKSKQDGRLGRASGYLVAAAGLFLALVGVFDKGFGDGTMHLAVAYPFFAFLALGVLVSIPCDWKAGRKGEAAVGTAAAAVTVASIASMKLAFVEAIFVACALAWLVPQNVGTLARSRREARAVAV